MTNRQKIIDISDKIIKKLDAVNTSVQAAAMYKQLQNMIEDLRELLFIDLIDSVACHFYYKKIHEIETCLLVLLHRNGYVKPQVLNLMEEILFLREKIAQETRTIKHG